MHYRIFNIGALCAIAFFLQGCKVGPDYKPPVLNEPKSWKNEADQSDKLEDVDCWWQVFNDPLLNELEDTAIMSNQDIYVAIGRVKAAWAEAGISLSQLFPEITLSPSYLSQESLIQSFAPGQPPFRFHQKQINFPLMYNYQLDLWRKLWYGYDASFSLAEAETEHLRSVLLTVTTDLASSYFQLRSLDQQLVVLDEAIRIRQLAVEVNTNRFNAGLVTYTDVVQASEDLFAAIANKRDVERLRTQAENQIAVLIGAYASEFLIPANPLRDAPPSIPAGLPSTLLLQRPDIAEAERKLKASNSSIGEAYASFFPTIDLTAALGYESPSIKQLFTWPSRYWSLGTNITQVIFDGGYLYENLKQAKAQYEQSEGTYRQTILAAFKDAEDALIEIKKRKEQNEALKERVKYAQQSVDLSQERYLSGLVNYLEVEVEQRNLLSAQIEETQSLGDRYLAAISLIKALGGGWPCP